MVDQRPSAAEIEDAQSRRAAFIAAVPPALLESEDTLPARIRGLNASPRSKLQRVYQVADELSKVRVPFVACAKGCASCCHMNVSLTRPEAERVAKACGRPMNDVRATRLHPPERHAGDPCPFLASDGTCSIYEDRPLSCRKHASYFQTAAACHPSVMNSVTVPNVGFSGLDQALFVASGGERAIVADIRDFFPRG